MFYLADLAVYCVYVIVAKSTNILGHENISLYSLSLSLSHWQIIFLGKVSDELFLKVVELKKIQGNVQLGAMKCQTREFLSFYPMVSEGMMWC